MYVLTLFNWPNLGNTLFLTTNIVTYDSYDKIDIHMKNSWITNLTTWSSDLPESLCMSSQHSNIDSRFEFTVYLEN